MGLKDLTIPSVPVKTPGGEFSVLGLSLNDITYVLQRHAVEVAQVISAVEANQGAVSNELVSELAVTMIQSAPSLAADIIAVAAGEPDQVATVRALPFPVQLDAIEKIGNQTFEVYGGPGKALEAVIRLAKGTTSLLGSLST